MWPASKCARERKSKHSLSGVARNRTHTSASGLGAMLEVEV